jgi:hypothetical protein
MTNDDSSRQSAPVLPSPTGSPRSPQSEGAVHSPLPWAVADGVVVSTPIDAVEMVTLKGEDTPRVHHTGLVAIVYGHHVGPQGARVFTHDGNMDFIVRAVNSHADLLAALKAIARIHYNRLDAESGSLTEHVEIAEAAIARAEGRA